MPLRFELGVLDLCRVPAQRRDADIVWDTITLAPKLESFGYRRYWLGEHHNEQIAHSSPELLIPILAGITDTMRIGCAGILLRYRSPFKVAKDFRLLNAVFPGRVDLGLARGEVPEIVRDLLLENQPERNMYEEKVVQLLRFLRGIGDIAANPIGVWPPEIWILGSSAMGASLAARNGACFCFAMFLNDKGEQTCEEAIRRYRRDFQPSVELPLPRWSVAVAGVCAKSNEAAEQLIGGPVETIGKTVVSNLIPTVVGDSTRCRQLFDKMAEVYETKSFVFLDMCMQLEERIVSHQLLAEALEIKAEASSGS
jgi:luciferase family oxidoreductase group 1